MKTLLILAGFLAVAPVLTTASAEVTTTTQNGGNTATVTQSGDAETVRKKIEQSPGHTRIDQRSGTNSSTIIQDGPGAAPDHSAADPMDDADEPDAADTDQGSGKARSVRSQDDMINTIRNGAPPRSRRNLDQLLDRMGMNKGEH